MILEIIKTICHVQSFLFVRLCYTKIKPINFFRENTNSQLIHEYLGLDSFFRCAVATRAAARLSIGSENLIVASWSPAHFPANDRSGRREGNLRVTWEPAAIFFVRRFPKHEWRRRENAYDRRDDWAISLCAFDVAAYLQLLLQQQQR